MAGVRLFPAKSNTHPRAQVQEAPMGGNEQTMLNFDKTHLSRPTFPWSAADRPPAIQQPLLIKQWKYLWPDELVLLRREGRTINAGWIDEINFDASILWVHLRNGMGRVLIHVEDGLEIWRVDPRMPQDPST